MAEAPLRPRIADAHIHLWDHAVPGVTWEWLRPGYEDGRDWPVLGNIDAIKAQRYGAEEFLAEVDGLGIVAAVHVQAAVGTPDPVKETAWLETEAERTGWPHALVVAADLGADDAADVLDRHLEASPRVRGVRDLAASGKLGTRAFARGCDAAGERGLVVDVDCGRQRMPALATLAGEHPDVTFVLDHAGYPKERTPEYLESWREAIAGVAEAPNVHCKVSGLGMADHDWTLESIRPWAEHCLAVFGSGRCLFGTNWPVDRLFSDYCRVLGAYAKILAPLPGAEQDAFFAGNTLALFAPLTENP